MIHSITGQIILSGIECTTQPTSQPILHERLHVIGHISGLPNGFSGFRDRGSDRSIGAHYNMTASHDMIDHSNRGLPDLHSLYGFHPMISVSPQGQSAALGFGGLLYTSDDNGKSFQLKYEFKPPVDYYRVFSPLGLAYDSNSDLWMYFVWDECYNETCEIPIEPLRRIYLARSTDSGKSFEHVLNGEWFSFPSGQARREKSDNQGDMKLIK